MLHLRDELIKNRDALRQLSEKAAAAAVKSPTRTEEWTRRAVLIQNAAIQLDNLIDVLTIPPPEKAP